MSSAQMYHNILTYVDFYDYLGLTFVEGDPDEERCRMQIPGDDRLRTPPGHVHGGVLASLIDVCGLYAVWQEYEAPAGNAYTTDMSVSFANSTTQAVAAHARIRAQERAGGRDELTVEVDLLELPETHEFATPYDPEDPSEQTLVASADLDFVTMADR